MPSNSPALLQLPSRVLKRDGRETAFDADKIQSAITRAGAATGEFGNREARRLTAQVVKVLAHRCAPGEVPDIERIQDTVEHTLISADHFATARAYIVYREQHKKLRQDQKTVACARTGVLWSMSPPRWTSTWIKRTGGSMPTPIRVIRWAA